MMTNGEKFRKEILALLEDRKKFAIRANNPTKIIECNDLEQCRGCLFDDGTCDASKTRWLISEYREPPVKLTRLEYLLLKLFYEKDYRYLTRGIGSYLYMNKGNNPPQKNGGMWYNHETYITFDVINDLFQFVQWEDDKPTSIKGILDNCVVKEN